MVQIPQSELTSSSSSKPQELYQGWAPRSSKLLIQHRLHRYAHARAYTLTATLHNRHPALEQNERALQIPLTQIHFPHLNPSVFQNKSLSPAPAPPGPIEIKSPFTIKQCKALKKPSTQLRSSQLSGGRGKESHHLWFSHAHARANDGATVSEEEREWGSIQHRQNTQPQVGWRKEHKGALVPKDEGVMKKMKGRSPR